MKSENPLFKYQALLASAVFAVTTIIIGSLVCYF